MSPVKIDRTQKPRISRGMGTTARLAVPGTPGPTGPTGATGAPGGSDASFAGWVNDTASQTHAALSATYARTGKATGNGLKELSRRSQLIAAGTATRVPWVTLLDSMASAKYAELRDELALQLGGPAGWFGLGNVTPVTTGTVTANTTDYTRWLTGETYSVGAAGDVTWQVGGGSPTCDTIHIFYFKDGAGTFKIQIDGVDEAGYTNVATTGAGELAVITITKARGAHVAKIVGLTGTTTILPAGYVDTTISGVVPVNLSKGGLELADFMGNAQTVTNLGTFLTTVAPAVVSYEAREVDLAGLRTRLDSLFSTINANTDADLIAFGAPWDGRAGTTGGLTYPEWVAQSNVVTRDAVEAAGGVYWDANTVIPDHATIAAMGWGADPVHPAAGYSKFVAPLLRRDLGFDTIAGLIGRVKAAVQKLTVTTDLTFAGKDRTAPEAVFLADAGGNDLNVRTKRFWRLYNQAGTTEVVRLVFDGTTEGWLPERFAVGSGRAGLWGTGASLLEVRRGGAFNLRADIAPRAVDLAVATTTYAASLTVNFTDASVQKVTLTGNITSLAFSGGSGAIEVELHLIQDGTGSRTLSGVNGSIAFAGGAAPTLSTTAGRRDIFKFRYEGGGWKETGRSMNVG